MSQQPQSQSTNAATTPLDLAITLALHNWPALSMAVTSSWGGPTSSDKRDWLCGAISDMLTERPETDAEDLEDVLIQVMSDEYDVVVDDESAAVVAGEIMEIKTLIAAGEMGRVERVLGEWEEKRARRGNKGSGAGIRRGDAGEEEGEESSSEDDEEGGGGDVEMDEAPGLVRAGSGGGGARGRVEPEVDEDGFTKVVGKKKR